jgi:hypothetical protein
MGKIKSSIEAIVSGKVGPVVYYQLRGKQYVRIAPDRKKDSWSPQQKLHRQRFSKVIQLWNQLKSTHIAPIWKLATQEMNGYIYFMKINMPAFGTDGSLTNPRELQLSAGKLRLPLDLSASRQAEGSPTIEVSWENDPNLKGVRLQDELTMVSYANGEYSVLSSTGLERNAQSGTFTLPVKPVNATHVYLFFASQDKLEYTESVCFELGTNLTN